VLQAIVGPTGTVHVAIAIAAGSILPSPVTLLTLELSRPLQDGVSAQRRVAIAIWRAITKRIVLAPVLGTLLSFSGVELSPLRTSSLQLIGVSSGGGALFLTGLVLSSQTFRLPGPVAAAGTPIADLAQPALAWALILIIPVPAEEARIAVLLAAMPLAFSAFCSG